MKRSRGRNRRPSGNNNSSHNNPNRHYESVGPDVKIRGSAQQVLDKYLQYARDAQTSGDRVTSEAYYQFAEHYQRIVAKQTDSKEKQRKEREDRDARDAQRREENSRNSESNNNENDDTSSSDDQDEQKGRRRRREREPEQDEKPANTTSENASDDSSENSQSSPEADIAEKPKKRRTYRKKVDADAGAAAGNDETDGVMKTLSRGRKPKVVKNDADAADDAPVEAAE